VHLAPEQVKVADVEAGELARPQYGVGQEADQQAVDRLGGILLGSELGYLFLGEEGGPERGPVLGLGGRQRHPSYGFQVSARSDTAWASTLLSGANACRTVAGARPFPFSCWTNSRASAGVMAASRLGPKTGKTWPSRASRRPFRVRGLIPG